MLQKFRKVLLIICTFSLATLAVPSASQAQHNHEPVPSVSLVQHNHAKGHNDYSGWASPKTTNCCNNEDCGELTEGEDWRETATQTEVKIFGEWCPVKAEHWITKGKSPDWTKAHACINLNANLQTKPCDRLLCFGGKPGT